MHEDCCIPVCPNCDEELERLYYCVDCDKEWTQKELDEHQERENESYVKWCKEQHSEWFE